MRRTNQQEAEADALQDLEAQPSVGSMTVRRRSTQSALQLQFLTEVHDLQQQLALVNSNPMLGLAECAELLTRSLELDLVAIWAYSGSGAVLLASHGVGSTMLDRCVVNRDPDSSPARLRAAGKLSFPDAGQDKEVPADIAALYRGAGLRSFVALPIGVATAPLGALLLAAKDAGRLNGDWWFVRLHGVSMGLLQHLRSPKVEQMAQLLTVLEDTPDPISVISVVLRSAQRYMFKATSMRMTVRLALLQDQTTGEALLFETRAADAPPSSSVSAAAGAGAAGAAPSSGGGGGDERWGGPNQLVQPEDADAEVVASHLGPKNTLLASAVQMQQARFIRDVGQYMQTCARPARDIFTRASELVSSLVVVPLLEEGPGGGGALGALYFALDSPCGFENIQDTMLGFIHGISQVLHNKLGGRAAVLSAMLVKAQRRQASTQGAGASDSYTRDIEVDDGSENSSAAAAANGHPRGSGGGRAANGSSQGTGDASRGSALQARSTNSQRLNTEAMLKLVQQEIRNTRRRTAELSCVPELVVGECLGRGGFGTVFRGYWHKVMVAVKVMHSRKNEREAMKDAVEMAVLSSVQHPNIVSVYSCLTDMVEAGGDEIGSSMGSMSGFQSSQKMRFRRLQPDEDDEDLPTCNILVMEFCDRGTLRDAVKSGLFHAEMPNGSVGVNIAMVVDVLLDVAYAVQYLHNVHLVHGDIKLENILLKSDSSRRLGATPKLADFGLTKILSQQSDHAVNISGGGTVTHLAPEMFQAGSKITTAVDAYAFGIFMWELYTRKRAYAGMVHATIIERVYRTGLRPRFPSATPPAFSSLAEACWQTDPARRPPFSEIADRLEQFAAEVEGLSQGADGHAAAA